MGSSGEKFSRADAQLDVSEPISVRNFADQLDESAVLLRATVEAACSAASSWPGRVTAALYAVLEFFGSEELGVGGQLEEFIAAGPYGVMRRARLLDCLADLLLEGRAYVGARNLPRLTEQTLVGGIAWAVSQEASRNQQPLERLLPELVELCLAPYLGAEKARRWAGCSAQAIDELSASSV